MNTNDGQIRLAIAIERLGALLLIGMMFLATALANEIAQILIGGFGSMLGFALFKGMSSAEEALLKQGMPEETSNESQSN
jgi:uncharacterized membrane protein